MTSRQNILYHNLSIWCRNLSSSSGLRCGPTHPVLHSFCLSMEQSVSQHSDPRLRRERKNKQKRSLNATKIFKSTDSSVEQSYFSLDPSFQASKSLLWSGCPLQPGCQRSRLTFPLGWDSGLPPHSFGGVQSTCAVSSLSRLDP